MSQEINPEDLTLAELVLRCEHQTKLYFKRQEHDSRYCFELFRRAIQKGDRSVWASIHPCYSPLVASWVKQHTGFESSGESVEYFVNGTFAKFALTLTKERFQGFSELRSLLSYLKMCVHSVIVDYHRSTDEASLYSLDEAAEEASAEASPEEQTMDRAVQQEIWEKVLQRLHDKKERLVVHGLFVFDLKPRELYDQFPAMFTDVNEIYLIKQNVLARLRRDPEIRKLLGADD